MGTDQDTAATIVNAVQVQGMDLRQISRLLGIPASQVERIYLAAR